MEHTKSPSLINLLVTAGVLITTLVYALIALNTRDPLWFTSSFDERPEQIIVNCYGEQLIIRPEDSRYDGLVNQVNEILSGKKYWDSLTISDESYQEFQISDVMMVVELYYSPRVRIHSMYKYFSDLDSIIIPLDGRHSQTNGIFGRQNNFSTAGSLHFENMPKVREYMETNGICVAP